MLAVDTVLLAERSEIDSEVLRSCDVVLYDRLVPEEAGNTELRTLNQKSIVGCQPCYSKLSSLEAFLHTRKTIKNNSPVLMQGVDKTFMIHGLQPIG